jgi:hypothetical protein
MQTQPTPNLHPLRAALRRVMPKHRATSLIGAGLGLVGFFFVGLLPSVLLGGSAGARLAGALLGPQAAGSPVATALMVLGVLVATVVGAALFAALGAVAGAIISTLTSAPVAVEVAP